MNQSAVSVGQGNLELGGALFSLFSHLPVTWGKSRTAA